MEIDYVALGKRVKQIRKERKISQEQLAKQIDVSVPHMSNIENGKTKFSLQVLIDLSDALKVTPDVLLLDQVSARGKARGLVLEEIDRQLSDCSEAQMSMLEEMVRNTKKLLRQYDKKINEIKNK
ncbi:MAG: helix-turn-helix transcriptional regulator [Lachnospiraceae bacterium]|nr:helix-turn-helix transcriptional regulator [Lachnospiraceae bacterium]